MQPAFRLFGICVVYVSASTIVAYFYLVSLLRKGPSRYRWELPELGVQGFPTLHCRRGVREERFFHAGGVA